MPSEACRARRHFVPCRSVRLLCLRLGDSTISGKPLADSSMNVPIKYPLDSDHVSAGHFGRDCAPGRGGVRSRGELGATSRPCRTIAEPSSSRTSRNLTSSTPGSNKSLSASSTGESTSFRASLRTQYLDSAEALSQLAQPASRRPSRTSSSALPARANGCGEEARRG